ncbi:MAG: hypothetical protein KatS3mg108_2942 [Isosphaeraceae bacterium]|jgi:hypothetical protein|nr:MAG: hypothetical protein KatS3mg108_2942 [Isosphaeraceae bacterium]
MISGGFDLTHLDYRTILFSEEPDGFLDGTN